MKRIISTLGLTVVMAAGLAAASPAAADQFGENPFIVYGTVTCSGESFDIAVVGIPQAEPGSEAAGRPGIGFVIGETTRLVPKSLTARVYVNGRLVFEGTQAWGFGVPNLVTCYQVLERTAPNGNRIRNELEFQMLLTPEMD